MFKKKKPKGALVKAATTIGKTAGKLVAVVGDTAEKGEGFDRCEEIQSEAEKKDSEKNGSCLKD